MSTPSRLFLGLLLGALFVLLVHPMTRPLYAIGFWMQGESPVATKSPYFLNNVSQAPTTSRPEELAYLLLIASSQRPKVSNSLEKSYRYLANCAVGFGEAEYGNAYWFQIAALMYDRAGDTSSARSSWLKASTLDRWDDLQTLRLQTLAQQFQIENGRTMAWPDPLLILERNTAQVLELRRYATKIVNQYPTDYQLRFATHRNGVLIREGARSIRTGIYGVQVMQAATSPTEFNMATTYGTRLKARQKFVDELRGAGFQSEATLVERDSRVADAWQNVVESDENAERRTLLTWASLMSSALPGAFLIMSIWGVVVWFVGILMFRFGPLKPSPDYIRAPLLGMVFGYLVYSATGLVWPSMWAVLSIAFFVFRAENLKSSLPDSLPSPQRVTLNLITLFVALPMLAFLLGVNRAGRELLPILEIPAEYRAGSTVLIGLSIIFFSIAVFSSAIWAILEKRAHVPYLGLVFQKIGRNFAVLFSLASVVFAPICLIADHQIHSHLEKIMINEPNYTMSR